MHKHPAIPSFRLVVVLLAVLWLSLSPTPLPDPKIARMLHPFDHVLLHAGLAVVCLTEWPRHFYGVLAGLIAAAIGLELFQAILPVRAFEIGDLLANLAGVALGAALFGILSVVNSRVFKRGA